MKTIYSAQLAHLNEYGVNALTGPQPTECLQ